MHETNVKKCIEAFRGGGIWTRKISRENGPCSEWSERMFLGSRDGFLGGRRECSSRVASGVWRKPAVSYKKNRLTKSVTSLVANAERTVFDATTRERPSPCTASSLVIKERKTERLVFLFLFMIVRLMWVEIMKKKISHSTCRSHLIRRP